MKVPMHFAGHADIAREDVRVDPAGLFDDDAMAFQRYFTLERGPR